MAGESSPLVTTLAPAESASRRLALLARASEELGASLDVDATARGLVGLLVPALADHAIVDLVDLDPAGGVTGQLRRAAMAHSPDAPPPAVPYTAPGDQVPYTDDNAAMRSLRSGRPVLVEHVGEADLMAGAREPSIAASLAAVGVRSQVAVPLFSREGVIGVLLLKQSTSGRRFTDDDVAIAAELAARAGVAIDNARRYAREHDVALTLQRSLMREQLTPTSELRAAARYVPASDVVKVGGDWYDLIPLGAGRVGLVIGDVMGRGLTAATVMGQVRAAARTLAHVDLPPRRLLAQLDDIVCELDEQIVTCSYAVYDPFTTTLCVSDAGHLPPLIHPSDCDTHELAVWQGIPLGVGGVPFGHCVATLPPDTVVAFYSDGLVERRDRDLDEGISLLRKALSDALSTSGDLESAADAVLRDMLSEPAQHEDDVTLLLVRTPVHQGDRATLDVTRDPSAVPNGRHFVQAQLMAWEVDADVAEVAVLLATELVTNAVRHGRGKVCLRLRRGCHSLYIEVDDDGSALPDRRHAEDDDEGGRGLQLVEALSEAWGTRPLDHGKSVWCSIKLPRQPEADQAS
jgi:anti-sigma regulatory factor (Ser/Thr protein kinase)